MYLHTCLHMSLHTCLQQIYTHSDMRKRADTQTLSAEISLDCGNFHLAAVNLLYKILKKRGNMSNISHIVF